MRTWHNDPVPDRADRSHAEIANRSCHGSFTSDSSQGWNGQIQACYKAGENPSDLQLLTKGSCPKGYATITWNIEGPPGPQGLVGPRGATGATGAKGARGG